MFKSDMALSFSNLSYIAFSENIIITAHPSKSGGAWWYGTSVKDGKAGFFPSTYVQELEHGRP